MGLYKNNFKGDRSRCQIEVPDRCVTETGTKPQLFLICSKIKLKKWDATNQMPFRKDQCLSVFTYNNSSYIEQSGICCGGRDQMEEQKRRNNHFRLMPNSHGNNLVAVMNSLNLEFEEYNALVSLPTQYDTGELKLSRSISLDKEYDWLEAIMKNHQNVQIRFD